MKKIMFWSGVTILLLLAIFYFIKIPINTGANYNVLDSLLGIIIFHNPFILALYILLAIILIIKGRK